MKTNVNVIWIISNIVFDLKCNLQLAPRKPNPLNISYPFFAKLMLIVQLVTGSMIIGLSVWVLLWAPSTRTRDNPYWSGIMVSDFVNTHLNRYISMIFKHTARNCRHSRTGAHRIPSHTSPQGARALFYLHPAELDKHLGVGACRLVRRLGVRLHPPG